MTPEDLPAAEEAISIEEAVWTRLRDSAGGAGADRDCGVVDELRSRVASIAHKLVRRGIEVDDIVQEALESTIRFARGQPTPPVNLNGFLRYRILHVLRKALRGVQGEGSLDEERLFEFARVIVHPTEALEEEELQVALAKCVSELTGPQAEAWRCTYVEGLGARAAASALSIAVNAFHVRMFHARATVVACLKRKGVLES